MNAALARLRRGAGRIWVKVKKVFHVNRDGWGAPPRDEAHALYRERFERFVEGLPALPRIRTNQTSEAFLAFSQTVQMLHEYGDDPIMPPGVKRIVRAHERLAAFGAVGQPSGFLGRTLAMLGPFLPYVLVGGLLLSVTGWGTSWWNGMRADRLEDQRDEARRNLAAAVEERDGWRAAYQREAEAVINAQHQAARTAETLRIERQASRAAVARERRRAREQSQVLTGGPPPNWDDSLRDAGPLSEPASPSDAGASGHPG